MKKLFQVNLNFNREVVTITIVSTLLLIIDRYHNYTGFKPLDRVLLYLVVPLLITVLVFRKPLKNYGFQLGDWQAGLALTGIVIAIAVPILWFTAGGNGDMRRYYEHLLTPILPLYTFMDLIGWEFFFRGWMLFGYAKEFDEHALWLQAVPFALAHLGKPEVETLSTIFGGFLFGLVAWRTKSFLYPFLIHWFIFTFTVLVAGGAFG